MQNHELELRSKYRSLVARPNAEALSRLTKLARKHDPSLGGLSYHLAKRRLWRLVLADAVATGQEEAIVARQLGPCPVPMLSEPGAPVAS